MVADGYGNSACLQSGSRLIEFGDKNDGVLHATVQVKIPLGTHGDPIDAEIQYSTYDTQFFKVLAYFKVEIPSNIAQC